MKNTSSKFGTGIKFQNHKGTKHAKKLSGRRVQQNADTCTFCERADRLMFRPLRFFDRAYVYVNTATKCYSVFVSSTLGTVEIQYMCILHERSAALYKTAINKFGEVYPGAKLAVCKAADIPSRPRARVWVPSEPSEPDAILSVLSSTRNFQQTVGRWSRWRKPSASP